VQAQFTFVANAGGAYALTLASTTVLENGANLSRGTLSQIEAQLRCVKDDELLALAKVLKNRKQERAKGNTVSSESLRLFALSPSALSG
jgi:hypothetical protein